MEVLKIGILGTWLKVEKFGGMVNAYPGCKVEAVWDRDMAKAESAAEILGCRAVETADEIINDPEIDGVMILTEYCFHTELLLKCAGAGKHILVEKPLCTSVEDAEKIRDIVKKSGKKFYMSEPYVSATTIFQKQLMDSGKLGRIMHGRMKFCNMREDDPSLENIKRLTEMTGGGMMSDLGTHALHSLYYLFGVPEKVYAHFAYSSDFTRSIGQEEYITIQMEYPDGVTASLECSTMAPDFSNVLEVTGTRGVCVNHGLVRHNRQIKYKLTKEENGLPSGTFTDDEGWVVPADDMIPEDPIRHVNYWLKMITEDISQEQFENDPLGNCGLSIDRAVDLVKIRNMIYEAADRR